MSMNRRTFVRIAGLLGIVGPLYGLTSILLGTLLQGNFNWSRNCLSDLGVSGVPYVPFFFNDALIIGGLLTFVFAIGLLKAYPGVLFDAGGAVMMTALVFAMLIGIFTEAPATSATHHLATSLYFFLFPISIFLIGVALLRGGLLVKGYVSIIAAIVPIALAFLLYSPSYAPPPASPFQGCAVGEIVASLGYSLWTIWMATTLVRARFDQLIRH